jgi:hypothetical protein
MSDPEKNPRTVVMSADMSPGNNWNSRLSQGIPFAFMDEQLAPCEGPLIIMMGQMPSSLVLIKSVIIDNSSGAPGVVFALSHITSEECMNCT